MRVVCALIAVALLAVQANAQAWNTASAYDSLLKTEQVCDSSTGLPAGCVPTTNSDALRDAFKTELDSMFWAYGVETFDGYEEDGGSFTFGGNTFPAGRCYYGSNGLGNCNTALDEPFQIDGSVYTNVSAYSPDASNTKVRCARIGNADDSRYAFQGIDLFGKYLQFITSDIQFIDNGNGEDLGSAYLEFSNPIDGFGFYIRDASSSESNTPSIIQLVCANGNVGQFPVFGIDHAGTRRGDVVYFRAIHQTCNDPSRCTKIGFQNIDSEDHFGVDNVLLAHRSVSCDKSSIGGFVYSDVNNNGQKDNGDDPIPGIIIRLLEKQNGVYVEIATETTGADGSYFFDKKMEPGEVYKLVEDQAGLSAYNDGFDTVGMSTLAPAMGGTVPNDTTQSDYIEEINNQSGGNTGYNYNFGELPTDPCDQTPSQCYTRGASTTVDSGSQNGVSLKFDSSACL
eukprot:CAMPEP_0183345652 /NCGR_PEP_ID=MMETSP0164_2-20130417/11012_1 /TAXON_ID=221442 /ORGANISM="Coccolithus pelagicus ssp braarudi, Strain PLY182g" /LENGTH=453 /DNA_ID=CAMNT_0025516819 /DNA_START=49 /DNA_END=1410 /DNA_ORIENTATION=-